MLTFEVGVIFRQESLEIQSVAGHHRYFEVDMLESEIPRRFNNLTWVPSSVMKVRRSNRWLGSQR